MLAVVHTGIKRLVGRLGQFSRAAEAAGTLGFPLRRALDRRWAAAVRTSNFGLLPKAVRDRLRVVVDVGANCGDWTDAILRLSRPEVLYAFEPNPCAFRILERRLAPRGVRCVQAAAGATPGCATLGVEVHSELSSIRTLSARGRELHGIASAPTRYVDVPLITLDSELCDLNSISLLKIDVQGYETNVLAGARCVLSKTMCLMIEVLYERDYYGGAASCLALARAIEDVSPLRLSCVSPPAMTPEGVGAWADAVFVNPSALT